LTDSVHQLSKGSNADFEHPEKLRFLKKIIQLGYFLLDSNLLTVHYFDAAIILSLMRPVRHFESISPTFDEQL